MESYYLDWANLLLRWVHVITAIAWIGASFYFVMLDNSLEKPQDAESIDKGVGGEQWAVHGGGFYNMQKYALAPKKLPDHLHWSYWESYTTWITGFALFTMSYLWNASTYLIDKSKMDWQPGAAISVALAFFVVFWIVYDGICQIFGRRKHGDAIVGVLVALFVAFAAWLACHWFAGRAAFLLVGAMMATTMSGNVFFWIIPGQRENVALLRQGKPVNPIHGQRGKQRSVHNTYFTLPVLFAMLSNHYSFTYTHQYNWVVLLLIMLGGAAIRQFFVVRHRFKLGNAKNPLPYAMVGIAVLGLTGRGGAEGRVRRCAESAGAALLHVPRRGRADEERAARHARPGGAACAGRLPAGGGHEDHADEQRDGHHGCGAGVDRCLVPGRLTDEVSGGALSARRAPAAKPAGCAARSAAPGRQSRAAPPARRRAH
jgi:uncharacterized membrane protein